MKDTYNSEAHLNTVTSVVDTLKYVKKFAGKTLLIKIGGSALEKPELVRSICRDLIAIKSVGVSIVLVHGGGPSINEELGRRQIQWEFVDGLRVTTPEMMDVIETVLVGKMNRRIVRQLSANGLAAVGFSGADHNTLLCRQLHPKWGQVGQVERVNADLIQSVLKNPNLKTIPVIAPIGIGRKGEAYNVNADWAASYLASALGVSKLIFLTDQNGILGAKGELLPDLDAGELEVLIESKVVLGGMLAKTKTIIHALKHKVSAVHVLNAQRPHALIEELFTERGVGTVCRLRSRTSRSKEERANG
ncbi:MAG: acetylglutamate kinase [Bdellovibrionales bacterium]|nr:acetylglutamate kinase [Bdellovibrionales bacterium]